MGEFSRNIEYYCIALSSGELLLMLLLVDVFIASAIY